MAVQGHPRSVILVKRVCNVLLVINSNIGPTLPRFRDIAHFLLRTATPPYSTNFWLFSSDYIADVGTLRSEERRSKLIICTITIEVTTLYAHCTSTL